MLFCVYHTVYSGDKLPPNYVGSTSLKRIKEENYFGSPRSRAYQDIWESELLENPHLFSRTILSTHETREEALSEELKVQKENNVVRSSEWINMAFAAPNGCFGMDISGELNPNYGDKGTQHFKGIWDKKHDEIVENMIKERNAPEGKKRMKRVIAEEWEKRRADGRYEKFCETMAVVNNDPVKNEKASRKIKDRWLNDPVYQEKMRNRKQGGRQPIQVEIDGTTYSSMSEASKATGLNAYKIRKIVNETK